MQSLSLFHFHCSISGAHSLVNLNDLNFNDVMCLVLHSKIKFFEGGGGVESNWSCIVPSAFKGLLWILGILWIFSAVRKTVRTTSQEESEESARGE